MLFATDFLTEQSGGLPQGRRRRSDPDSTTTESYLSGTRLFVFF
jgi:hypothetical protein